MLRQGHGTILFTGASASVKGYPRSSSFAMGKFALRGLAQSLARELQSQNIHVGHIVIDGGIGRPGDRAPRGVAPMRCSIRTRSRNLSATAPPASQRLDLGNRAASLGREFLRPSGRSATDRTGAQGSFWGADDSSLNRYRGGEA